MERDSDLKFFRRTSTFEILDCIYSDCNSFEKIKEQMKIRNHKRQDHDIKYMISTLERVGLIEDYKPTKFGIKVKYFMNYSKNQNTIDDFLIKEGTEILREFYKQGFLLNPFLLAIQEDAQNKVIAARFFQEAKKFGFYNLNVETDHNDFVPSMKNFAVYLGFARRKSARGKVELTQLSEAILKLDPNIISDRKKCDLEYCRVICPANAIYNDYISGCVKCGLCARCCPYGAVSCTQNDISFNFMICSSKPDKVNPYTCPINSDLNEIIGSEKTMQIWFLNLLRICNIEGIIPGPGKRPDLIINRNSNSTIIECKSMPIRGKKIVHLEKQLQEYMSNEVIEDTKKSLNELNNFYMKDPDVFFLSAPESSSISEILGKISKNLEFPLSFISTESLFELHKAILKRKIVEKSNLIKLFSTRNQDISKELIQAIH